MKTDKKILDAYCGARMMWFDKCCSEALFMDIPARNPLKCGVVVQDYHNPTHDVVKALKIQNPHAPKEYVEEVMRRFYTLVKGK